MNRILVYPVVAVFLVSSPAWGQAVPSREPTSTHIFPAGGKRGTVVKVRVGGECFPPGMNFQVQGSGVTAASVLGPEMKARYEPSLRRLPRDADGVGANMAYPREFASALAIEADAEPGPRLWRAWGGWGGTRLRPFLVGDLPEFIETEPNTRPEQAERVTLPVVINGQIAGERDQDFFVFSAKAGDVVVCDVLAARIGSPLEPVIAVTDAGGKRLEVDETRAGGDPVVALRVPADGDYRLHVANLSFFGGPAYVYRITVSTRPYIAFAFPPGGRAGETRDLDMFTLTGAGAPRVVKEKLAFPARAGMFRFRDGLSLLAGDLPEVVETADNHSFQSAMEIKLPVTVNARFSTALEEDWFRFTAKQGEMISIACQPFPRDSAAVPLLTLVDSTGAPLAKAGAIETPGHALELDWKAPADGVYRLRLRDLQHGAHGGPEFIYRLTVRPARPDFELRLDPDYVNVVQGGRTEVNLLVRRSGGFNGPIDLTVTGLPDGVKIEPARVADGLAQVKLVLSAKDDTRPSDAKVSLHGRATIAGKTVEHRAAVSSIGWQGDALHLTVQHKPVFRLDCNEAYQYAHRGTIYPYLMKLERLHGFDGPITLQLCDRQVQDLDGIEIVETVVPPGASAVKNFIYLPETMHASVQHHCRPYAQAHATFTDKWGQRQTLLAVSEKRCIIRTLPPVVKLRAVNKEIIVQPGATVACKLALDRTSNFRGPAEVELIDSAGFKAHKAHLAQGESVAIIHVHVDRDLKRQDDLAVRFRATGKLAGGATVITVATVAVRLK